MDLANYWFSSGAAGGDYEIANSLRFRGAQSLSRTPTTQGNLTTFTASAWVKNAITNGSVPCCVLTCNNGAANVHGRMAIDLNDQKPMINWGGSMYKAPNVLRDPGAWYHLVWQIDTTQATASNRVRIWINGELASPTSQPPQNQPFDFNETTLHYIGRLNDGATNLYAQAYFAEYHYLDGTALPPTSFGEYDDNGVWIPKEVSGVTYGTNGFYLDFSDPADIGADRSGNGNNFTPTGFELTDVSISNWDWRSDSPTNNHATLNPILPAVWAQNIIRANSSSYTSPTNGGYASVLTQTIDPTQDFYVEGFFYANGLSSPSGGAPCAMVFVDAKQPQENPTRASTWTFSNVHYTKTLPTYGMLWFHFYRDSQQGQSQYFYQNGSGTSAGTFLTPTSGSCLASGGYQFGNPNYGSTQPRTGIYYNATARTMTLFGSNQDGTNVQSAVYDISGWNCDWISPWAIVGQTQFQSGFFGGGEIHWYTSPEQWVIQGRPNVPGISTSGIPAVAVTDPSDHFTTILDTGANILTNAQATFPNGLWWIKDRDNANQHQLVDSINGTSNVKQFPTLANTTYSAPSGNSVAWCWATPASGINTTAGFSINNGTHGLGVTPAMLIDRGLNVWHQSLAAGKGLKLYSDAGITNINFTVNATTATGIGGGPYFTWAEIPGYSAFGSYTGNGSADGPFVYTGFRPAFLIAKSAATWDWRIYDNQRNTYNPEDVMLRSNLANGESVATGVDFLSNGFKLRTNVVINVSGNTIYYAAFAEHPMGAGNVSPSPAR